MGTDAGAVNCAALPVVSLDFRALLHSLALCPCPPHYRHKPCTIRRSRSVCVNLPCTVRWWAMGGLLRGPRAMDIAEVAGAPDTALRVLGMGVPRLVLVPGFGWASQQISACHSQYHWSTFCTKCFHSLNTAGSSTSASESLMQSGSACFSQWQSARSPQLTGLNSILKSTRKSANFWLVRIRSLPSSASAVASAFGSPNISQSSSTKRGQSCSQPGGMKSTSSSSLSCVSKWRWADPCKLDNA
jgi:hypothetical protein